MRYTRLRKAVEAGHFKGATLVQPNLITASLSQLANPHSRRIGNNPPYGDSDEHDHQRSDPREDGPVKTFRTRSNKPINLEEEEEEEDDDDDEEVIEGLEHLRRRKRRGSTTDKAQAEDDDLFFPDTSKSSRPKKRVKRRDSDVEDDQSREGPTARSKCDAEATAQRASISRTSPQARLSHHAAHPQNLSNHAPGAQQVSSMRAPIATPQIQQNYNGLRPSTQISRKKQSANAAAQAAYNIGVGLGKWAPHPADDNIQGQAPTYIPAPNYAQRLVHKGARSHSPAVNAAWQDTNVYGNATSLNGPHSQLNRAMYPHKTYEQGSYMQAPYYYAPNSLPTKPSDSTSGIVISPHLSTQDNPSADPQPQPQSHEATPQNKPSEPNRFHPALVFEGFNAPRMLSYSASSRSGTGIQQNGEMSLLHKVMMERDKDKKPTEQQTHTREEAGGKKATGVESTATASTSKRATANRKEHEGEAVPGAGTGTGNDNGKVNLQDQAESPTRTQTTSTVNQGNTTEKK